MLDIAWIAFAIWEWLDSDLDVVLAREHGALDGGLVGDKELDGTEQQDSWVKSYLWLSMS